VLQAVRLRAKYGRDHTRDPTGALQSAGEPSSELWAPAHTSLTLTAIIAGTMHGSWSGCCGHAVCMKAILLTGYGDVDKLELRDVPEPRVGPGEIMVRIAAASLNPVDWKTRSGALKTVMPVELPAVLGKDAAGEIVEIGPGVTGFAVGDRVMGNVEHAYAERVVAKADRWIHVPAKLDLIEAAAIPLVALTGAQLIEAAAPAPGQILLITGAAGSVGRAAVFAAKRRGARICAGVRRRQKDDAAKLGADTVVALDDERELATLPALDAIADTVDGDTLQKLLPRLKTGGTLATTLGKPRGADDRGFSVRAIMTRPDAGQLTQLAQAAADKQLIIPIVRRFPFAEFREAHSAAERGADGKVLLVR
jgi:NADPH:quinone reductase-like Zn-dependent oxidoreductase